MPCGRFEFIFTPVALPTFAVHVIARVGVWFSCPALLPIPSMDASKCVVQEV